MQIVVSPQTAQVPFHLFVLSPSSFLLWEDGPKKVSLQPLLGRRDAAARQAEHIRFDN